MYYYYYSIFVGAEREIPMVINMRAGGLVVKMEEFCFEYLSN